MPIFNVTNLEIGYAKANLQARSLRDELSPRAGRNDRASCSVEMVLVAELMVGVGRRQSI